MVWLLNGGKKFKDTFIRCDIIHERDGRTDRHHMTAEAALMHSIARQKLGTFYNNIIPYRCVHNILTCLTVIL